MSKRVDRQGMLGPYGVRYSWVYWAAIAAAFALLIVDIFDDGAIWNYGVIVFRKPPRAVQRLVFSALTPIGRRRGYRATYPSLSRTTLAPRSPHPTSV